MYRECENAASYNAGIGRGKEQISYDIECVKEELLKINERLDIKELLFFAIMDSAAVVPDMVVPVLEAALAEAESCVAVLRKREAELTRLRNELYEYKCEREA